MNLRSVIAGQEARMRRLDLNCWQVDHATSAVCEICDAGGISTFGDNPPEIATMGTLPFYCTVCLCLHCFLSTQAGRTLKLE